MSHGYGQYVEQLKAGNTIAFRPKGSSMLPRIKSGQKLTIKPLSETGDPEEGDVVFCKVRGHYYTHLVSARQGERWQISNNHGHVNGWVGRNCIFGKVVQIED